MNFKTNSEVIHQFSLLLFLIIHYSLFINTLSLRLNVFRVIYPNKHILFKIQRQ